MRLKVKYLTGKNRLLGLINSEKAYPVLIQTRFGIHTFGMRFPIDILILDKNNKVVKISKNLKPNRIFLWNPMFDKVIELPAGEIEKRGIRLETKINLATGPGFEPE